jgi:cell division protein FtsB
MQSTTTSLKRLLAERLTLLRRIKELEQQNDTLRQQRDAANAVIQEQNRIIAGDTE